MGDERSVFIRVCGMDFRAVVKVRKKKESGELIPETKVVAITNIPGDFPWGQSMRTKMMAEKKKSSFVDIGAF